MLGWQSVVIMKSLDDHQQKEGECMGNYVAFRLQFYDIMPSQVSTAVVPVAKALLGMCSCHPTLGNPPSFNCFYSKLH